MTGPVVPGVQAPGLLGKLVAAVRPEFRAGVLVFDPADPVFGRRGVCLVPGCGWRVQGSGLCQGHLLRWKAAGRPDLAAGVPAAMTAPWNGHGPLPSGRCRVAGVAPVTRQSGKHSAAGFRWAVSKPLRDAVCDFAGDSRHASPWAAALYAGARDRGKDYPHAVRITARAWIYVIWRCWQDGTAYDPAKHRALQRILDQQHPGDGRTGDRQ